MIQDYFGQETIWKLLGTHPYKQNGAHVCLNYLVKTPKANKELVDSILCRIPKDKLVDVEMQDAPNEWQENGFYEKVVKRIVVKNVFGNESEVIITS